jgi:hypothetical protein
MIENHVPTLETCKKLKEAGFPQETQYGHFLDGYISTELIEGEWGTGEQRLCAAPILTEILEQLPDGSTIIRGDHESYWSDTLSEITSPRYFYRHALDARANPAEAAALLWLELHDQEALP